MRLPKAFTLTLAVAAIAVTLGAAGAKTPAYAQTAVSDIPAPEVLSSADSLIGKTMRGHGPDAASQSKAGTEIAGAKAIPAPEVLSSADSLIGATMRGHGPKAESYHKAGTATSDSAVIPAPEILSSADSLIGATMRGHGPKAESDHKVSASNVR